MTKKWEEKKNDDVHKQFKIFSGGVSDIKNITANEYRDLMFQIPFALVAFNFPIKMQRFSVNLTKWYLLARKKRFTVSFFFCSFLDKKKKNDKQTQSRQTTK